jgi:hypothetical protein
MKRTHTCNAGVIAAGVQTVPCFVAPVACVVEQIDAYFENPFSANASNTLRLTVALQGVSGTILGTFAINTSAASHAYSAGQRIRITPTANNSLSQGTCLSLQTSCVCQANTSQTILITTFRPLTHRESR